MPRILSREEILGANDLPTEEVPTPEWFANGAVLVRALTASEWIEVGRLTMHRSDATDDDKMLDLMIKIPALCIVDEHGQRLFTDGDLDALGKKNPLPLKRIMDVVQRLSDLDQGDAKKG
jgi:hypothetical protein